MANRAFRYYFGRLNIISAYTEEKKTFLERGLNAGTLIPQKSYTWGFYEIESILDNNDHYLSGFLVKYNPLDPKEIVNNDTRTIEQQEARNHIKSKARFFLHIKTGIISYQPTSGINEKSFRKNFSELLEASYENFLINAEIQLINREESFFNDIRRLDSIEKIFINLHPSNPTSRNLWKRVDERLQDLNVESYVETYKLKNQNNTLSIVEDEDINSKLHIASDGYGEGKIKGKKDEEAITITTGDNPIEAKVENL
jgi:hypothetical protein